MPDHDFVESVQDDGRLTDLSHVDQLVTQHDASALKYFVHAGGPNKFQSNTYKNSLGNLRFAGVGLSITRPQGITVETNPGPIRARIRRLGIYYS